MSDDQDGCEWVNVSSGTRVVADKRPLNGCVCNNSTVFSYVGSSEMSAILAAGMRTL